MVKKLKRALLLSWPVRLIHNLSARLHDIYFAEFDPFNDAAAK
jgi:hypothetical protein